MTLGTLWHICTPEQHATCQELQLTIQRPEPRTHRMVIEFRPPHRVVEELGEGPVFAVSRDAAQKWPHTISYR